MLIALCALALGWLIPTQISTDAGEYDLSPSFFPTVSVSIVLGLAFLLLVVRGWQLKLIRHKTDQANINRLEEPRARSIIAEFVGWTLAVVTVFWLLPIAGFLPTAVGVVIVGARVCRRQDWIPSILLGVAFCWSVQAATWSVFTVALP